MNTPLETINEIVKIYESTDMDNEVLDDIMRAIGETDPDKPAAGPWQDGEPSVNYQSTYLLEFEENDEHDSYIRMGTWSYGDNPRLVDLDNRCPFEDKVKRHAPINLPEE